jgi:hypothetical protein
VLTLATAGSHAHGAGVVLAIAPVLLALGSHLIVPPLCVVPDRRGLGLGEVGDAGPEGWQERVRPRVDTVMSAARAAWWERLAAPSDLADAGVEPPTDAVLAEALGAMRRPPVLAAAASDREDHARRRT